MVRLGDADELAGGDRQQVVGHLPELLTGSPGVRLHVLLAGGGVEGAEGGGGSRAADLVELAGGALVDGGKPGLWTGIDGELGIEAGELAVHEAVQPLHGDLGEVGQGGGDGVHAQADGDSVVAGGGGETAVQERRGIRWGGQEKVPRGGEVVEGALRVGDGLRGDTERHRGLHKVGARGGIRCAGTDVVEHGGQHGVGAGQRGVVDRAGCAEDVNRRRGGEGLELDGLRGFGPAHEGVRQGQRRTLDQAGTFLGAQGKRLGLAPLEAIAGRLLDAVLHDGADADEGLKSV